MAKINWSRVFLGGLLWSVVYNVLWTAAWYLFLQGEWTPALEALGRRFPETPAFFVFFVFATLVLGVFSLWFYAAIRPQYGPGPKTAAGAAVSLWLVAALIPSIAWALVLQLPLRLVVTSVAASLVGTVAATLAGAWLYKE